MRRFKVVTGIGVAFLALAGGPMFAGQSSLNGGHQARVCNTLDASDCYTIDTSRIGGLRFEDYKVTNPTAVQFDPAARLKELSALGPDVSGTLCITDPGPYIASAPTIMFNSVKAQIREVSSELSGVTTVQEFLEVQFANLITSDGYANSTFGFKMTRIRGTQEYFIAFHPGNPGLENVVGLTNEVRYGIDPIAQTATFTGPLPSSAPLRQALLGILLNLRQILSVATFSTQPAASGQALWSAQQTITLASQAQSLIAATATSLIPVAPITTCSYQSNGYANCVGTDRMVAFENMILQWGGVYLGLRSAPASGVLKRNLLAWAQANAPIIDPGLTPAMHDWGAIEYGMMEMSKPIAMLWPTLREDPSVTREEQRTIDSWLDNKVMPIAFRPGGINGSIPYVNNWGYFGASVQMADAIRRSDHTMFANAVQAFYVALHQMRADGSFPLEAMRGACSATYTNVDLLHLTSIAEMAAAQGYDLYSLSVDGKTLESAIAFLLNARENPALMNQYSKVGGGVCFEGKPGDPADFASVFNNYMPSSLAWAESYIARFPFSTTAGRLRKILGNDITVAPRPMYYSYTGLNASCAFYKPYEAKPVNGVKVSVANGNGPNALSVMVTDNSSKALTGVLVSFAVVQGSANIALPAQLVTDSNGRATATVTLGPTASSITVTASALGTKATFTLVAVSPIALTNRGGTSLTSSGSSTTIQSGYARIQAATGSATPSGIAIYGYRSGGYLVSETGVPATPALKSGRIYAEVNGPVGTGLAIANPNNQPATINFFFTDPSGNDLGPGSITIPANQQTAKFLDSAPFKTFSGATFQGTFTFTSDIPVGVVAIRSLYNERRDFLMATLPVIDLTAAPNTGVVVVPHFSDGGGWTTQILLVNPTGNSMTGSVEFRNENGSTANVTIGSQTNSTFPYSVPARSSQKLATGGNILATTSGSVRIIPNGGAAPTPLSVFSYEPLGTGITVSQAGVSASSGTAFRMYAESSGAGGEAGNIQTGIAIANNASAAVTVTLELTNLDGSSSGLPAAVSLNLGGFAHVGQFLDQFFPNLGHTFQGMLRISTTSSSGISVVGLRSRYNERRDFLITTTPPTNETLPPTSGELLFPQIADGGGYTTQFILFSGTTGLSSSALLVLVQQFGSMLGLTLR